MDQQSLLQIAAVERARRAIEAQLAAINALPAALLRRAFRYDPTVQFVRCQQSAPGNRI